MTKSCTPCRWAFRFGRSAGAPQNGQAVVLPVVQLGLAYLGRLPKFFSGSVTATTRLDQELSHPLNCLVIFDVLRQPGISTCLAASFCSGLAQRVSDVLFMTRSPFAISAVGGRSGDGCLGTGSPVPQR
jgi:hypothetical protein